MAQAVLEMRPGSTLGFGPPIEDGCYYDFILSAPISEADFAEIERRMERIIGEGQSFVREELPREEALRRLDEMGEPYKREYAEELLAGGLGGLTFYRSGPFLDMCDGPHVGSTTEIPSGCFRLRAVAGAYWRGRSDNVMMTRLYVWAMGSPEELETHVTAYREAQARDHKRLGREHDIYVVDDEVGKGLPLWLPNGTVIRDELERLMRELEFKARYKRVATPHLAKADLYYKTGHLPYYASHMFPQMELRERRVTADGEAEEMTEVYCLKPMNCPHHHRIFAARPRTYRELPLRLAEYGQVYRMEDSGALSGLLRVRGMCMNDAHIYCTEEQIKSEFISVMQMHRVAYEVLGLSSYYMRFSTWDPDDPLGREKYVDNPAAWEKTQRLVREAITEAGLDYVEGKGEAAFYGPKIDVQFTTVTGREETASTNQLDFAVPARLGLSYVGPDGEDHVPYVIHRAPLGTHERFVAFLLEHFGGAFPTWLAPVQAFVLPISDKYREYGEWVVERLRENFIRAEIDPSEHPVGKKIRNAVKAKLPNVLVVGQREQAEGAVTLRRYGRDEQETVSVEEIEARLLRAIKSRGLDL
jgi:threonyl-tRNA synthetase